MIEYFFIALFGNALGIIVIAAILISITTLGIYYLVNNHWPWQIALSRKYKLLHHELREDVRKLMHRTLALENKK